MKLNEIMSFKLPRIVPPTDDVHEVMDANFFTARVVGPKIVPIEKLIGGANLENPRERKRVDNLAVLISSPNGFISRIIVDTQGNVIEGQHRLEALRKLGATEVPVVEIEDLEMKIDYPKLAAFVKNAQPNAHREQRMQVIRQVLTAIAEEGSVEAVKNDYEPPRGFESAWNAALEFLSAK
jgi:hypothetical protein